MKKVNANDLPESSWSSPTGKFSGAGKHISEALGRKPLSMDLRERHPFDVEISRIPPGKSPCPYHSHSAQWEFYYVLSGQPDRGVGLLSGQQKMAGPFARTKTHARRVSRLLR
jgi:hypothetical protein